MDTVAVVLEAPGQLALRRLALRPLAATDVVVTVDYSGISTGTERLLYDGRMPAFPGMGYPLVPGYESVGHVVDAGPEARAAIGTRVFVPGANCYTDARGLFGGAARTVILPAARTVPVSAALGEEAVLIALAATAYHALAVGPLPQLIIGHGVLGRLLARLTVALGGAAPTVWETNVARREGATGYRAIHPDADPRRDYHVICDASGDATLLDTLIGRLAPGGEIILAGFYEGRIDFGFAAAFMREARLRIAAQWQPADLAATLRMIESGALSLGQLITHRARADAAARAYPTAFGDAACLKMVLDWSGCA